jgi:hypothetical protein
MEADCVVVARNETVPMPAQNSSTFFSALSAASSVVVSNSSLEMSPIGRVNPEVLSSLNLTSSFAIGKAAVFCKGSRARDGVRCNNDQDVCDCDAYGVVENDKWSENQRTERDAEDRRSDADTLGERVRSIVGDADDIPFAEIPPPRTQNDIVQISRKFQALDNIKIVAPPAIDDERVDDADYDAEDEAQEAVPEDDENALRLEDGDQLITKNDMWEMMTEFRNFENERCQADNAEAPPLAPKSFAEAVDRLPDGATLTATQTITHAKVRSESTCGS